MKKTLITTVEEAVNNAILFHEQILEKNSNALKAYNRFYNWFYFPDLDLFAPSKFIGYQRTKDTEYTKEGDGGDTQERLEKWFSKVTEDDSKYSYLIKKLEDHSKKIGKTPSKRIFGHGGIYILSDKNLSTLYPDEDSLGGYSEGNKRSVLVNRFERDKGARNACLSYYGYECQVCEFDFEKTYGSIGLKFIHVHHIIPLSVVDKKYKVNPITDLIPVCPNCHAMIHKTKPVKSIDEMKRLLKDNSK